MKTTTSMQLTSSVAWLKLLVIHIGLSITVTRCSMNFGMTGTYSISISGIRSIVECATAKGWSISMATVRGENHAHLVAGQDVSAAALFGMWSINRTTEIILGPNYPQGRQDKHLKAVSATCNSFVNIKGFNTTGDNHVQYSASVNVNQAKCYPNT